MNRRTVVFGIFALILIPFFSPMVVSGQATTQSNRFALLIGNSNYIALGGLSSTLNDTNAVASTLQGIGFDVINLRDASLLEMEEAALQFGRKLAVSLDSIGFVYYSGYGIQSNENNYLIPVDARVPGEVYLKTKAFAVSSLLDIMVGAKNSRNVIVLDACRNNPFPWANLEKNGLASTNTQPSGSVIVYSAQPGLVTQDGTAGNGVFVSELIKHLTTPGLEIKEVFSRTAAGVGSSTNGLQVPMVSIQMQDLFYLSSVDDSAELTGSVHVTSNNGGILYVDGKKVGVISSKDGIRISNLDAGDHILEAHNYNGQVVSKRIKVVKGKEIEVFFNLVFPQSLIDWQWIKGGDFYMGSSAGSSDETPVHKVGLSSFMIGIYEVTQSQYLRVMGTNTSHFAYGSDALQRPVENVTWYNAVEFCNKLSEIEGFPKVYTINGRDVKADFLKKGIRLPTEAEWEYAARGGQRSKNSKYSGSNTAIFVAWYRMNSLFKTHPVGLQISNELDIKDMSGNVSEWCWDWYGNYSNVVAKNPQGPSFGEIKVIRGGSWNDNAPALGCTFRTGKKPSEVDTFIGFRVVHSLNGDD